MRSIFSRKRAEAGRRTDPENRPDQRHDLLRSFVPASARPHETQRLYAPFADEDENDGPDEDIEFLSSLVEEIDHNPPDAMADPRVRPSPALDMDSGAGSFLRARPTRVLGRDATTGVEADPRVRPAAPGRATVNPLQNITAAPTDEEKLNVFRAVRDEPERVRTSHDLGVPDVDLDDLLEDLSTTAAAIRRRRAA
jgi:hypothetical protein